MRTFSLMNLHNRLAVEGEELIAHRFPSGLIAMISHAEFELWRLSKERASCRRAFHPRSRLRAACGNQSKLSSWNFSRTMALHPRRRHGTVSQGRWWEFRANRCSVFSASPRTGKTNIISARSKMHFLLKPRRIEAPGAMPFVSAMELLFRCNS